MTRSRTYLFGAVLGMGVLCSAPLYAAPQVNTQAAPTLADAKKHYGEGEKKFKAGDYAGALTEFKAADDVKSTPQSQRYIGLCQDNLGHYADAVTWYEKFLTAVPDKMKKEGRRSEGARRRRSRRCPRASTSRRRRPAPRSSRTARRWARRRPTSS